MKKDDEVEEERENKKRFGYTPEEEKEMEEDEGLEYDMEEEG